MNKEILAKLGAIRKAMSAALRRNDRAEYHCLGALHRQILHAASPGTKAAWEQACAR